MLFGCVGGAVTEGFEGRNKSTPKFGCSHHQQRCIEIVT